MRIFKQWVLAIALYLALVVEGALSVYLQPALTYQHGRAGLLLLPIAVLIIAYEDERNEKEIWLALAAGVVADLYFWGIIGIYTFILPSLSAFGRWYARVFPELFVFRLLGNIVAITVSCLYTWLVFRLIGWTDLTLKAIGFSLLYTAGWTTGISLATYWLWAKLARSYPFLVDLDNYRY